MQKTMRSNLIILIALLIEAIIASTLQNFMLGLTAGIITLFVLPIVLHIIERSK